jgi:hypothetical protein
MSVAGIAPSRPNHQSAAPCTPTYIIVASTAARMRPVVNAMAAT